jgi:putative transposase
MPRVARSVLVDCAMHVVQRGIDRSACFFAEADYRDYLRYLGIFSARFGCSVHAYCLMTNHVHLLVTPHNAEACALLMKNLAQCYVQGVNQRLGRTGTLWEGRFYSCLAPSENHVLACYRYIELNPVLAGMVATPAQYRWSSYAANAQGKGDSLLRSHQAYDGLGLDAERRSRAYREMCDEGVPALLVEEIRKATRVGCVIGTRRRQRGRPPKAK